MAPKPGAATPPEVSNIVKAMPTTEEVLRRCITELGYDKSDPPWFQENFTTVVHKMMDKGRDILHEEQEKARDLFDKHADSIFGTKERRSFLRQAELSLRNQMMKRAGVHFERIIEWLLDKCEVQNEDGQPLTGRSDRVCPSIETFRDHPENTVILEYKRTIRERWKEIRDEISKVGHSVWFVTLDDHISESLVEDIATSNITLFVAPEVYSKLSGVKERVRGKLRSMDFLVEDIKRVVGSDPQTRLRVS